MGLFHPQNREEQAHYVYHENARFREDLRGNKKTRVRYEPSFWSEWNIALSSACTPDEKQTRLLARQSEGVSDRTCATLSSRCDVYSKNLRCPPPSHSLLFCGAYTQNNAIYRKRYAFLIVRLCQLLAPGGFAAVYRVRTCVALPEI